MSRAILLLDATSNFYLAPAAQEERERAQRKIVCGAKTQGLVWSAGPKLPGENFNHWLKGGEWAQLKLSRKMITTPDPVEKTA